MRPAPTWVACAAAGGEVRIKNVIPRHLESISAKLREMGVSVIAYEDSVVVKSSGSLRKVSIKTMPYPGFPTDMQPQFAAALCCAGRGAAPSPRASTTTASSI